MNPQARTQDASRPLRLALVLLLLPLPCYAYIDPASGAMLLQGLVALIAVIVAFIKNPVGTIKGWIARRKASKAGSSEPPSPGT